MTAAAGRELVPATYTVPEVAALLGLPESTAYLLARGGRLPFTVWHLGKTYRIPRHEVDQALGLNGAAAASIPVAVPRLAVAGIDGAAASTLKTDTPGDARHPVSVKGTRGGPRRPPAARTSAAVPTSVAASRVRGSAPDAAAVSSAARSTALPGRVPTPVGGSKQRTPAKAVAARAAVSPTKNARRRGLQADASTGAN